MKTFVLLLMSLKDITNLDENNFIQTHKCIKKVLKDENSGSTVRFLQPSVPHYTIKKTLGPLIL